MTENHKLSIADIITLFRIIGVVFLLALQPFSATFFCVYALTGLSDVLDGLIARKTHTESRFGARLDSIADLLLFVVILFRIFPFFRNTFPKSIWCIAAFILIIRITAYIIAAVKYRSFASLHTYLNKLTGILVFFIPFLLVTRYAVGYYWVVSAVAATAALEELAIHLKKQTYQADTKSIFQKKDRTSHERRNIET
ncbi:MAG: CDP-alcohol phosphatidyltransferase family protein [Acutalibacteraceae bacterium]